MIHNKIHLIRAGLLRPNIALTVQNRKPFIHHSFILLFIHSFLHCLMLIFLSVSAFCLSFLVPTTTSLFPLNSWDTEKLHGLTDTWCLLCPAHLHCFQDYRALSIAFFNIRIVYCAFGKGRTQNRLHVSLERFIFLDFSVKRYHFPSLSNCDNCSFETTPCCPYETSGHDSGS